MRLSFVQILFESFIFSQYLWKFVLNFAAHSIVKRMLKRWWSTIQSEQSRLILTHGAQKGTTTDKVRNLRPGLGQAQNYGGVTNVNKIPTSTVSPAAIHI